MKKLLTFLILGASFGISAADGDWYNWIQPLTIKDIRVQSNRNVVSFRTEEAHQNIKPTCNAGYYSFPKDASKSDSDDMGADLLSMLLTAKISSRKIGINVDATKCSTDGRILVTQVRIL